MCTSNYIDFNNIDKSESSIYSDVTDVYICIFLITKLLTPCEFRC